MSKSNHEKAPTEASGVVQREILTPKVAQIVFVAVCAVVLLVPSIGMAWSPTLETTENRKLAEVPTLEEDGRPNVDFMSDLGAYFEDHFAYRNELVTLDAKLRTALGTSPTDSVVVGEDDWLFYGGTLHDFTGKGRLTDREMDNLAFNFSLVQGYCEANGARFALAVVPNKNSVYPEKMPFYYGDAADGASLDGLAARLNDEGVCNADLYSLLVGSKQEAPDDLLYYKADTHWNQRGALLGSERILEVLDRPEAARELEDAFKQEESENHQGDLGGMLYPADPQGEQAPAFPSGAKCRIVEGANEIDTEASAWIEAKGEGSGVLYMFRDSFAQNMLPFLASVYETSFFDWYVPFDYTKIQGHGVTDVVVEKTERSLGDLASNPGIMPAPTFKLSEEEALGIEPSQIGAVSEPSVSIDGSLVVIEGKLPESLLDEGFDDLYLCASSGEKATCCAPFRVTLDGGYGYRAYVYEGDFAGVDKISLLVDRDGKIERLLEKEIK